MIAPFRNFLRALLLLSCVSAGFAGDEIPAFGFQWKAPIAAEWKLEPDGPAPVLRMLVARPSEHPRRPVQFVLAETPDYQKVAMETEVKRLGKSIIIVYAYRDAEHFNYAHLSSESASQQPVHNGIFHVYGGDRVRISNERGPASIPSADEWYRVRLTYDGTTGVVDVTVNGKTFPSLHAVDLSLGPGKVGLGSFFETALFRNVKITGTQ